MNSRLPHNFFLLIIPAIFLILIFLCHGLVLQAQFMVDDFAYLRLDQKTLEYQEFFNFFLKNNGHHFNPLDKFVNFSLFKLFSQPAYLYGINLLLFYGNTLLLYFLVKVLTNDWKIGFLAGVLFAIHPLNAEILSHITLNSVFLCAGFLQMSMICFWLQVSTPQDTPTKWLWISLGLYLPALFLLETALLFPAFLALLCLLFPFKKCLKILRLTLPFWMMAVSYFVLWCLNVKGESQFINKIQHLQISFSSYLATASLLVKWYIKNLFFPDDIVFIKNTYPLTEGLGLWLIGLILVLGAISFLFWIWKKTQKNFALGWFLAGFIFMLPASVAHAYKMGMVIEPYWFYFSSMGFFMLLSLFLWNLKDHLRTVIWITLLCVIILFWGIVSYRHHVIARTEMGYLQYWLQKSPDNFVPSFMLGVLYGYEEHLDIPDPFIPTMGRQAESFIQSNQYVPAARLLEKLIKTQSSALDKRPWKRSLAALYSKLGETAKTPALLTELLSSGKPEDFLLIAFEMNRLGLEQTAIEILDQGLNHYPLDSELLYLKAVLLANQDRFTEALAVLAPEHSQAKNARFLSLIEEIHRLQNK